MVVLNNRLSLSSKPWDSNIFLTILCVLLPQHSILHDLYRWKNSRRSNNCGSHCSVATRSMNYEIVAKPFLPLMSIMPYLPIYALTLLDTEKLFCLSKFHLFIANASVGLIRSVIAGRYANHWVLHSILAFGWVKPFNHHHFNALGHRGRVVIMSDCWYKA